MYCKKVRNISPHTKRNTDHLVSLYHSAAHAVTDAGRSLRPSVYVLGSTQHWSCKQYILWDHESLQTQSQSLKSIKWSCPTVACQQY
jgi:hypothetical protein